MRQKLRTYAFVAVICVVCGKALAADTVPVTVDNFVRAESDLYFSNVIKQFGFGKFGFQREPTPIDQQTVIRMNRDTLYGGTIFDLDAGPVTITLPDPGKRFMSVQVIDEDEYTPAVFYGAESHTLTKEQIGTRYVLPAVRVFADPNDPEDLRQAQALQDAIKVEQPSGPGKFEVPDWDPVSQKKVRDALLVLGSTLPNLNGAFGTKKEVDPVRHLIGAAAGWGGNPEKDAIYLNVTPSKNDGKTIYKLDVKDVPVEAFWSITVYNAAGHLQWERTFAVITVPSNELVGQIHDRMPAILERTSYDRWLGLEPDPHNLLITYPSEPMTMWPMSTRVNKPENDEASLLNRTGDPFDVWAALRSEGRA